MQEPRLPTTFAPTGLQWLFVLLCGVASALLNPTAGGRFRAGEFAIDVFSVVALATLVGWIVWFVWRLIGRGQWRQNAARLAFMLSALCLALIALREAI